MTATKAYLPKLNRITGKRVKTQPNDRKLKFNLTHHKKYFWQDSLKQKVSKNLWNHQIALQTQKQKLCLN